MRPARAGALVLAGLCGACVPPAASSPSSGLRGLSLQDVVGGIVVRQPGPPSSSRRIVMREFSYVPPARRPLMVVDGRPWKGWLDPADVAKVHMLSASAAVKRYGSRAAHGAVLITTKGEGSR